MAAASTSLGWLSSPRQVTATLAQRKFMSKPSALFLAASRARSRQPLTSFKIRCKSVETSSTTTDGASDSNTQDKRENEDKPVKEGTSMSESSTSEESSQAADTFQSELARLKKEREQAQQASKEPGFLQGVIEETGLIEWPSFGNVVSTTGLVLAVIVSATVAILIVNAILAELSDRIFAIDAVSQLWRL